MSLKIIKGLSNTSLNSKETLKEFLSTYRDSIESSFDKILEIKIKKAYRLEDQAKILVFDNFVELISGLCTPKVPSSIMDVDHRLKNYTRISNTLKPSDDQLESMKTVAMKGKKNKLCLPYEKLLNGFKSSSCQFDSNVLLYVLTISERIIQTYIDIGCDYQCRAKLDEAHMIYHTTMQIIFSKYSCKDEQLLLPIYTSINKLTKLFTQNYTENIKNFVLFLKDSREQLDILIKIFKHPLETEESVQDVFGNIDDVLDSLSLVLDTLDDSTESNRKYMAMDMMDLAEMAMFTPFKIYAKEVVLKNDRRDKIEELLKSESAVDKLVAHYNSVLSIVFAKCTLKRCNDLKIRYRLLHSCEYCHNPLNISRYNKTYMGGLIPSDERRNEESGYGPSISQLSISQERASSCNSSVSSRSDSPRITRTSSPIDQDLISEDRLSKHSLDSIGCNLLVNCYKYLLPRLLLFPVFQFLFIYQILEMMSKCEFNDDEHKEEMRNLEEVVTMLKTIIFTFEDILSENTTFQTEFTRLQSFFRLGVWSQEYAKDSRSKLTDIKAMVKKEPENWEWPSSGTSEFIMEGPVQVRVNNKKSYSDRYLYLFSNMLLVCKKQVRKTGLVGNQVTDLKLKQRILLDQFHIIDNLVRFGEESDDLHSFILEYTEKKDGKKSSSTGSSPSPGQKSSTRQLSKGDSESVFSSTLTLASTHTLLDNYVHQSHSIQTPSLVIYLSNLEDKSDWVASLLQLQTKKLFSQYVIIKNTEEVPLKLPDVSVYRFAEPDTPFNIEYEQSVNENSGDIPVIKMATLEKLITHLTSHAYCDAKTLNSFLLIFRNFTTAETLLDLLIERFDIPDPSFSEAESRPLPFSETSHADRVRKKFRTSYKRKMQLRVVNLVTKWINNPHYFKIDFASNPPLLDKLQSFLNQNMVSPHLAQKIKNVKKNIESRLTDNAPVDNKVNPNIESRPSLINLQLCPSSDKFSVINVHPFELACQITLYEWRLYSKIEFWEVNGLEKQDGPNFIASIDFSNKMLYWLINEIMRHRNLQDRVTAILRVADLMQIFEKLNNLQGAQECKGALISASVYRLKDTFEFIASKHKASYRILFERLRNDYQESSDSYIAQYQKKIHNISSPGLPYIAMGDKTQLIHMNLKNPNYFTKTDDSKKEFKLINFWKFRQMSELIQHYLSFQNTRYNFIEQPLIQTFLGQLDIFKTVFVEDHYQFDDFAHKESLIIQPKFGDAPSFPDRQMTADEIKQANYLNNLSIKEKMDESQKLGPPDSPPPLPPKGSNIDQRKMSYTAEPTYNYTHKMPPVIPVRPIHSRRGSHEHSMSTGAPPPPPPPPPTTTTTHQYGHSPSPSDTFLAPQDNIDGNNVQPPPIPNRALGRESSSPPSIPPRLPPLPSKNSDSI